MEVDLGESEGVGADRFDPEGFEQVAWKVTKVVRDDRGGANVDSEGEDVAVLG